MRVRCKKNSLAIKILKGIALGGLVAVAATSPYFGLGLIRGFKANYDKKTWRKFYASLDYLNRRGYVKILKADGGLPVFYGVLDLDNGKIKADSIKSVVDLDIKLPINVVPPRPLQKKSTFFGFHNANWFFDFEKSAQKMLWFFNKAEGFYPEGIIVLNQKATDKLMEDALKVSGKEVLLADFSNFSALIKNKAAFDFKKSSEIASDLSILWPEIISKLKERGANDPASLMKSLYSLVLSKDLLFYLR